MSQTAASLRRQLALAGDLATVVRTMKAMAAAGISQYEGAVQALDDYDRTVQLGLLACFRQMPTMPTLGPSAPRSRRAPAAVGALLFGSDQGLVGQFNEQLVAFAQQTLQPLPGERRIWAVGERIQAQLADSPLGVTASFPLPTALGSIASLVSQVLLAVEACRARQEIDAFYLFHNRPCSGELYQAVSQRLLPLDESWRREIAARPWPSQQLPEVLHGGEATLLAFVSEYLFVSLFRACAESLASENTCRLAAMQRAEKNIGERLDALAGDFHRLRQSAMDEELFDVVAGFTAGEGQEKQAGGAGGG
ncbi:F0F1 ATP synthase subunit gamma [Pseudaeromonas sp. ZJS20]|uniref:F0F1 ATP synthase subunit gamma n=1 Tax=Pseudaeromonas aegiceratis TaxID=3153928 RepID=UPI00390CBBAF